ncbi:MAG: bactofilin family protein [Novosphingobium sp.]
MFQKSPAASPRVPAASPMGGSTFSVFGADIRITGDVAASADLHVDGRIEGDVTCTALVQGEGGEIVGAVTAETARLAGTVRGSISVRELVILKSAKIHGDVHYDALTIEQGAQVDGRFAPHAAAKPAEIAPRGEDHEPKLILAS